MGQPNFTQFAAAASSVLANASQLGGLGVVPTSTHAMGARSKHVRSTNPQNFSQSGPTVHSSSSSAKRTRLEGGMNSANNQFGTTGGHGSLPAGARGQNLVSLVSPSDGVHSQQKSGTFRTTLTSNKTCGPNHPAPASSRTVSSSTPLSVKMEKKPQHTPTSVAKPLQPSPSKTPVSEPHRASPETVSGNSSTSARSAAEDILICGNCRRLFDQVDELISHKMAGCSLSHISCEACRCRSGEPENLECAYCGAAFRSAWGLMHHCHNDHGLTIYALPSPTPSPNSSHGTHFSSDAAGQVSRIINRSKDQSVPKPDPDEKSSMKSQPPISKASASVSDCSGHADDQDVSDWEADRDAYDVNEETQSAPEKGHEASASDSVCSRDNDDDDDDNQNEGSIEAANDKETHSPTESPRHRRGEYGRHETLVDDEDEDGDHK
ncbi:unnamed protein product [Dicrocoelium dendriticum]|nr:unnamed protein product [Dicrocoelium dendriticum]